MGELRPVRLSSIVDDLDRADPVTRGRIGGRTIVKDRELGLGSVVARSVPAEMPDGWPALMIAPDPKPRRCSKCGRLEGSKAEPTLPRGPRIRVAEDGVCNLHRGGYRKPAPATDIPSHAPAVPSSTPVLTMPFRLPPDCPHGGRQDRCCLFSVTRPVCFEAKKDAARAMDEALWPVAPADVEQASSTSPQADSSSSQPEARSESQGPPAPSADVESPSELVEVGRGIPAGAPGSSDVLDQLAALERALDTAAEAGLRLTELEEENRALRQRNSDLGARLQAVEILNRELSERIAAIASRFASQ